MQVFESKKQYVIDNTLGMSVKEIFGTSIWDDTLYKVFYYTKI